jgi:hypothetical protein
MMHHTNVPIPRRLATRPTNAAGYIVPWFVAWIDGVPDFRVIDSPKINIAVTQRRCWLCGEPLGAYLAFVIGPMCAINRVSSEPPSHRDCAEYAAQACPFLTKPHMRRREDRLPEHREAAGIGLKRNPGVALVWITKSYRLLHPPTGGVLFTVGDPIETRWFAEGREATRDEVLASIDSGLPLLREPAEADGPDAVAALERMHRAALDLVPA